MGNAKDKTISLGGWTEGINNVSDPSRLKTSQLQSATNVDIDDSGMVSRREGYTSVYSGNVHSLWSDGDQLCYFVENGNLRRLLTGYTSYLIKSGIGDSPMSYALVGSKLFCTNSQVIFYVEDDIDYDIQVPTVINKYPLPSGQLIEYYMGRIYVASGETVWFSDAIKLTQIDKRKNFKVFRSKILMLRAVTGGLYVSDSKKTYYMAGDIPERMTLTTVLDYPATFGTDVMVNGEEYGDGQIVGKIAIWSSASGVCVGLPGGQVMNVTQSRYRMPEARKGAGLIRKTETGINQYLSVLSP